jgi:hypothetical protein
MSSYFEIGGMIVEAHMPVDGSPEPPRIPILSRVMLSQSPQGFSESKGPAAQGAAGGTPESSYDSGVEEWGVRTVGSMMVRTGAAMLLIPDPLEPISTPIAAGLVLAGVALHATTW